MRNRRFLNIFLFVTIFALANTASAYAGSQKLGDIMNHVRLSWAGLTGIMSTIAYLMGGSLGVIAIYKFKDHVDNPQQTPISAGVKRMLAGGMMLSLPFTIRAVHGSMFGTNTFGAGKAYISSWGANTATALTADGLDHMVVMMMSNIAGPMEWLLTAFAYLSGIGLLLVGISRLTKRMEEGPRGPAGFGTIMTFLASGALFNFGSTIGVFVSSLMGDNELLTKISVATSVMPDAADRQKIEAVLEGVEVFVIIVGYIAFIRGWFVLKNFADGQQGATMAQGLTFLFGGALAINIGELINALQYTVGINPVASGLSFS
ncbi:MAG: hypothetical protein GC185_07515 [Alphaproteobacteria bacterium]|nr:hypothetical protein [Alphaproteobacteria bacterium]